MENYINSVRDSAKNHISKRYANSSLEHARLLTEELINYSEKEVNMLSNTFHNGFYSALKPVIKAFLDKDGTKFKLLTSDENSKILQELKDEYPDKFITKIVPLKQFPIDKDSEEEVNFLINDQNGFRYEYSDKNINNGLVEAVANFNSSSEVDYLREHFNTLFEK